MLALVKYWPGGQLQAVVPDGHDTHAEKPLPGAYAPTEHAVATERPTAPQKLPVGQGTHAERPLWGAYRPMLHATQLAKEDCNVKALKTPAAQYTGTAMVMLGQTAPGGHGTCCSDLSRDVRGACMREHPSAYRHER